MKILVTGSTGLVGTALVSALAREGHTVCRMLRPQSVVKGGSVTAKTTGGFEVAWNPETGDLGGAAAGADAVVNLAGASIAQGRWTAERKELLRSSRIETTRALVRALAQMNARPRVLVSASAIGYYGSKAEALEIRVVLARIGIVLAKQGGALPKMMLPFKIGAGGRIGSGQQWMSWVTLEEVVGILRFAIENATVRGAVNVVAPQSVRNAEFTKVLAKTIRRPALFPAPAIALRLALGELADALLLSSQRVAPAKLHQLGHRFLHPDLHRALTAILAAK